jgi:serine/threonine protein kinase
MNVDETHLYFIDFGLSKAYINPETGEHVPKQRHHDMVGTPRFASPYVMRGMEPTRRDDLISLGYVWVYLFKGALPWQGLTTAEFQSIIRLKEETSPEDLCFGMPEEFAQYFSVVLRLHFNQEPPYALLRNRFCELFRNREYIYDCKFDWMQRAPSLDRPSFPRRFSLHSIAARAPIAVPRPAQPAQPALPVKPIAPLFPPLPLEPAPVDEPRPVANTGRPPKLPLEAPPRMSVEQTPRLSLDTTARTPSLIRLAPPRKGLTLPSGRRLSLGSLIANT